MEGDLKRKREELKALERQIFNDKKSIALKNVVSPNSSEIFEKIKGLFTEQLKDIDATTMDMYDCHMRSNLQGGPSKHELFRITFTHTDAFIKCEFEKNFKCKMYLVTTNNNKRLLRWNDPISLESLIGVKDESVFAIGLLLSFIASTMTTYLTEMSGTDLIVAEILDDLWGNVYSLY